MRTHPLRRVNRSIIPDAREQPFYPVGRPATSSSRVLITSRVAEARLDAARDRPSVIERTLPTASHRDPSQVIPDAAADIRWRRFTSASVRKSVGSGRLIVRPSVPDDDEPRADAIAAVVTRLLGDGYRSIGIYTKTNSDAVGLSAALTTRGVDHVPIGFSEAYGEALSAMLAMVTYGFGQDTWESVTTALATVLTATVRSSPAPPLALAIHSWRRPPGRPRSTACLASRGPQRRR